ncbi:hypothetical protein [Marinitoga sp. 1155]|uniref:hypothetical protein n=1 Tax=Marinitoga sp. 1155 TaxID=1428448 RepID=UPI0006411D1F|nr:hypothetical protein [Marinitoga sp. 1155]KLO21766.1 hypothetical protein X274_09695 [Marinitoga sp. 1155]
MKLKIIFILILVFILSSCIKQPIKVEDTNFNDLTNSQKELLIRLIATGYNRGGGYSFENLKKLANENGDDYDDNVLYNYKYFIGKINTPPTKVISVKSLVSDDDRIKEYVNNIINRFSDNSNKNFFIDAFDSKIPTNPIKNDRDFEFLNPNTIKSYEKRDFLVNKVYNLIKRDYSNNYLFKYWYDKFFKDITFNDDNILFYSKFLVDIAYAYTNSDIELKRLQYTGSELYPEVIKLNHIPVELILAIMYQESKFFPGSFRAEISNGNIYALSFGLTHVLIDADFLYISNTDETIGDGDKGERSFDLISYFYLGNNRNEETYFSDWDLITIRGSILYSAIYLDMLYQKLIKYIK